MKDLTVGKPNRVILAYVLPLFGSIVFQQIYNIADSVIAGKFIGESALAAVGNSYEITLIYLAFAFGCNMGASILTAKLFGNKRYKDMKTGISTSYIISIVVCLVLMLIGLLSSKPLLIALNTPDNILNDSLQYLNIYTYGILFLFLYNIATGIFAAIGDSKTPFAFLVVSSLTNIGLDILFVAKFNMGVGGVAWATFICQGVSCVLSNIVLFVKLSKIKVEGKIKLFDKNCLKNFLYVGIPSTIQQGFVSVSNTVLQGLINSCNPIGTVYVTAGYAAAIKFNNFAVTSLSAIGNGISTYSAQNLAAGKIDRVKQGCKWGIIITTVISLFFVAIYVGLNKEIMLLFLNEENVDAIGVGHMFLTIVPPFYVIIGTKIVCDGVQRGGERIFAFMSSTIFDLIIRLVFAFPLARYTSLASTGIWVSWPIGWILSTLFSVVLYFFGKWKNAAPNYTMEYKRIQSR